MAGEAAGGPGSSGWAREAAAAEEGDEEAGPERQRLGRGAVGELERQRPQRKGLRKQGRRGSNRAGEAAIGPERQRLGRGAAAMEEEDEEAGPERQQMGRRGSGLAGEQQVGWRGSGL